MEEQATKGQVYTAKELKAFMLRRIDEMLAQSEGWGRSYYLLGPLTDSDVELVRDFISSFDDESPED